MLHNLSGIHCRTINIFVCMLELISYSTVGRNCRHNITQILAYVRHIYDEEKLGNLCFLFITENLC